MIGFLRRLVAPAGVKPVLGLIGIVLIQTAAIWAISGQRDRLQRWQDEAVQATREAALHPKLSTSAVPQQIRNLGVAIEHTRLAMAQAKASALAKKMADDAANEARRKDANDALVPELSRALRNADAYARSGGLQCASRAAQVDRGNDGGSDLSSPAASAEVTDRSGAGPALVSIPRAALDTCTTLKVRLDNAHDWAVGVKR